MSGVPVDDLDIGARARSQRGGGSAAAAGPPTRARTQKPRPAEAPRNDRRQSVDRDALLATLFPRGIPAREDVIRAVNNWLDEAERLARAR